MAYLVRSLVNLRGEIDRRWPNRDRRTDGWYRAPNIGPPSQHHPDGKGAVHAIDVDKDGINPDWIVAHIRRSGGVLWYMIWNRTIWSATHQWQPRPYSGPSPHTDHMHFSVYLTATAENYSGTWGIAVAGTETVGPAPPTASTFGSADPYAYMTNLASHVRDAGTAARNYSHKIAALRR